MIRLKWRIKTKYPRLYLYVGKLINNSRSNIAIPEEESFLLNSAAIIVTSLLYSSALIIFVSKNLNTLRVLISRSCHFVTSRFILRQLFKLGRTQYLGSVKTWIVILIIIFDNFVKQWSNYFRPCKKHIIKRLQHDHRRLTRHIGPVAPYWPNSILARRPLGPRA